MAKEAMGWRKPDAQLVTSTLARLGDPQHRRIFYDRLKNPLWVTALARRDVFRQLPATRTDNDGNKLWLSWPEGDYLARMASLVPDDVVAALGPHVTTGNPIVAEALLRIVGALPPDKAVRFIPLLESLLKDQVLRSADSIVDLSDRLIEAGLSKPALRLLNAAFRPQGRDRDGAPRLFRGQLVAGVEPYWFRMLLPRVVTALSSVQGAKALTTLAAWLEDAQIATDNFRAGSGYDLSYITRPSIGEHEQNQVRHDYIDDLIDTVRDIAISQLVDGRDPEEVVATFERGGQPLLLRIALHALAVWTDQTGTASDESIERLNRPDLMESNFRHEYAELARTTLPLLDDSRFRGWSSLVMAGPPYTEEELEAAGQRFEPDSPDPEGAVRRVKDWWRLRLLSSVGRPALRGAATAELDTLEAQYGPQQHSEFPAFSTSWVGVSSPFSTAELGGQTTDSIFDLLRSWAPDPGSRGEASQEGLANALEEAVHLDPDRFLVTPSAWVNVAPLYVNSLFHGLEKAVQDGKNIDWPGAFEVGAWLVDQVDDGRELSESTSEFRVWRFAQKSLASLLDVGSAASMPARIPVEQLSDAIAIVAPLLNHADPTPQYEGQYGGNNMDALTLSLNTTRPVAIRAMVKLGLAASGRTGGEAAVGEALTFLAHRLRSRLFDSHAEAAAVGEGLGRLLEIDRQWVIRHEGDILPDSVFGEVVMTTALATYRPSRMLVDAVEGSIERALRAAAAGGEVSVGWRTDRSAVELIGDQLVMLIVWGQASLDEPIIRSFFDKASSTEIGRVLGKLGWLLDRSDEDLPEDLMRRSMELWDSQTADVDPASPSGARLDEFFWWSRSNQFPVDWWLPRLDQATRSATFDPRGLLGEVLEAASAHDPALTVEILERVLLAKDDLFGIYNLVDHAPVVLAAAQDAADPRSAAAAQRVMDVLGRKGFLDVPEAVRRKRAANELGDSGPS